MADEVRVDLTANDQASPVVDKVADAVDQLDGTTAEVTAEADDKASGDLDRVEDKARAVDGTTAEVTAEADDKASGDLDRVESEVRDLDGRKARVSVEADTAKASGNLDDLADKFDGLASGGAAGAVSAVTSALGPLGVAAGAAGATVLGLADHAADAASEVATLAQITGESVDQTSRLAQVWATSGGSAGDLADVIAQVNGVLAQQPALAKQLGIALEGASPQDVFIQAVEAASGLESAQQRLVVGSQLFGEEGVRQVAAVNSKFSDLSTAITNADPMFSDEDIAKARDYQQSMTQLNTQFQAMAVDLGTSVLPLLKQAADLVDLLFGGASGGSPATGPLAFLGGQTDQATGGLDRIQKAAPIVQAMLDGLGGAAGLAGVQLGTMAGAASDAAVSVDQLAQAQIAAADADVAAVDAQVAYQDAVGASKTAAQELAKAIHEHGAKSTEAAAAQDALRAATTSERSAAIGAAQAAVRVADARAQESGSTLSARDRLHALNQSLLTNARTATPAARDQIIAYIANVNHIPLSKATEIVANADTVAAETELNNAARPRNVDLIPVLRPVKNMVTRDPQGNTWRTPGTAATAGGPAVGTLAAPAPAMAAGGGASVVVQVDARGALDPYQVGRAVKRALGEWQRVSGRWQPGAVP